MKVKAQMGVSGWNVFPGAKRWGDLLVFFLEAWALPSQRWNPFWRIARIFRAGVGVGHLANPLNVLSCAALSLAVCHRAILALLLHTALQGIFPLGDGPRLCNNSFKCLAVSQTSIQAFHGRLN